MCARAPGGSGASGKGLTARRRPSPCSQSRRARWSAYADRRARRRALAGSALWPSITSWRRETSGPFGGDGRTITLGAKTRTVHLRGRAGNALHVWARPAHVEVLDEEGRREVVRIHDVERAVMMAVVLGAAGYILATRALRRGRSR